jgi:hypothetical protein
MDAGLGVARAAVVNYCKRAVTTPRAKIPSLLKILRQCGAECLNLAFLLGIDEVAVRAEGLKSRGDGDLVGEQGDSETLGRSPWICIEKALFFI